MKLILALCLTLMPVPALAQGWGDLDALLTATLSPTGGNEASYWLPDSADPAQATQAIGILYAHIPGSAGSVSIHAGLFRKAGGAFSIAGQITGLFGSTPRDAPYFPRPCGTDHHDAGPRRSTLLPESGTALADRTLHLAGQGDELSGARRVALAYSTGRPRSAIASPSSDNAAKPQATGRPCLCAPSAAMADSTA